MFYATEKEQAKTVKVLPVGTRSFRHSFQYNSLGKNTGIRRSYFGWITHFQIANSP